MLTPQTIAQLKAGKTCRELGLRLYSCDEVQDIPTCDSCRDAAEEEARLEYLERGEE